MSRTPILSVIEPLILQGWTEAEIALAHPTMNVSSIHGAAVRIRRRHGLTPQRRRVLRASVPNDVRCRLEREAKRRGYRDPDDLAAAIVRAAVSGGFVDMLIDGAP